MELTCNINFIESRDNKKYKLLKKLNKKKYRDENNIFLAEGEKFFKESKNFNNIIISNSKYDYFSNEYDLNKYNKITVLADNLFKEISTQENSQGVIFVYSKSVNSIKDIKGDVIILDDVQDPGNVGTIIRTLVALDYKNLILTSGSVDVYNPKAVRSSMGSIFKLNIIYESYDEIIKFIQENEYNCYSTALASDSVDYRDVKLKKDKNAYIFGHEGGGVSDRLLEISKKTIIPISKNVNSLNVSVALAVFLYKMRELI